MVRKEEKRSQRLPDNVTVENVHLAESLMTLTYNVHNREESENE